MGLIYNENKREFAEMLEYVDELASFLYEAQGVRLINPLSLKKLQYLAEADQVDEYAYLVIAPKVKQIAEVKLIQYEDSQLENKYIDFANLMREYHDGILLFEVSNKEVWEKAIKDKDGLEKYFNQNKKNYSWSEPRYKGFVVKCKDEATAKSLKKAIKKMNPDSVANYIRTQVNNDSVTFASVERGLWKQGENSYVDLTEFKQSNAQVEVNEELPMVIVIGKMLKKPATYIDVRGSITADYQNYLEKIWIDNLRNKYTVEINQEVLNSLR